MDEIKVGPITLRFYPDGDDPGTGELELETKSGYRSRTDLGVELEEWHRFVAAVTARSRRTSRRQS